MKYIEGKKENQPIIMFDGICNVCNHWVQFVIKRDPKGIFKFLSLQSDLARSFIINHNPNNTQLDSIILVDKGQIYTESTAILRIINKLTGPIRFFILFWIIPEKSEIERIVLLQRIDVDSLGKKKVVSSLAKKYKIGLLKRK